MHRYPFVTFSRSNQNRRGCPDDPKGIRLRGKSCHLCDESDDGPGYDLWHVLFECPATSTHPDVVAICDSSVSFLLRLSGCDAIEEAVRFKVNKPEHEQH